MPKPTQVSWSLVRSFSQTRRPNEIARVLKRDWNACLRMVLTKPHGYKIVVEFDNPAQATEFVLRYAN